MRLGIGIAVGRAGLLGEPIGDLGVAAGQQAARDDEPLAPPQRGANRGVVMGEEQLGGASGIVLLAPPARLLEGQPRIRPQLRRNPRQYGVEVGRVAGKREARLRHGAVIGRQQRHHAAGRLGLAVP